jgi:hypothetical protein
MADRNGNPNSKQADGNSESFKTKPTDKEGTGSTGGRTGSGVGSSSGSGGTDSSTGKSGSTGSEVGGYSAGDKERIKNKNKSEESEDGKT